MGLFGKIFDKKECSICGGEIGLLGNRKLEDGNCCKECAKKLSPWFEERRHSTVEDIKRQLAYREENKRKVAVFHATKVFETDRYNVYIDEHKGQFTIARELDVEENPDIVDLSQIVNCELNIEQDRTEEQYENQEGEMVDYNPPRYKYSYKFSINIGVNSPWFDDMNFDLHSFDIEQHEQRRLMELENLGNQIVSALRGVPYNPQMNGMQGNMYGQQMNGMQGNMYGQQMNGMQGNMYGQQMNGMQGNMYGQQMNGMQGNMYGQQMNGMQGNMYGQQMNNGMQGNMYGQQMNGMQGNMYGQQMNNGMQGNMYGQQMNGMQGNMYGQQMNGMQGNMYGQQMNGMQGNMYGQQMNNGMQGNTYSQQQMQNQSYNAGITCEMCGWQPEDMNNIPKFCPQCGNPLNK